MALLLHIVEVPKQQNADKNPNELAASMGQLISQASAMSQYAIKRQVDQIHVFKVLCVSTVKLLDIVTNAIVIWC